MNNVTVLVEAEKSAMLLGHPNKINALVKVQVNNHCRPDDEQVPINLAIVIDRSGSMSGASLDQAKLCAELIVDGLRPIDTLAIIAFSNEVDEVWPIQPVTNKAEIKKQIQSIHATGDTNLHGGWLEGVAQLVNVHEEGSLSRVIVLSDGLANKGELSLDEITRQCQRMAATGITTSTCGVGERFSERFLTAMAESGEGNSYYGELAEDLSDTFLEELSLLKHTYAKEVVLKVNPLADVKIKLLNGYKNLTNHSYQLPNLAWGAEAWALLEISTNKPVTASEVIDIVTVTTHFTSLHDGQTHSMSATLNLGALHEAAFSALAVNEEVRERLQELEVAEVNREARILAQQGRWQDVEALIEKYKALMADSDWLVIKLEALAELAKRRNKEQFSKEAYYSELKMQKRLKTANEYKQYSVEEEMSIPEFLRRKQAQGKKIL